MLSMNDCLLYVMNDVYFLNMISLWWIWETNATYDQLSSYQEYGLRSWSEEEIEIDIALAQTLSFLNKMDCICTFGCLTGQVEGSKRDASLDNGCNIPKNHILVLEDFIGN